MAGTGPVDAAPHTGPQPSLVRRLISGSSWRIAAQVMPLFVNLALTPFVILTLGPIGYGMWLITSTLTQFIGHFDGGIGRSAQYFFSLLAGTEDRAGTTRLLISLSAAVVVVTGIFLVPAFLLAEQLARFFQAPPEMLDDTVFLLRVLLVLVAVSLLRNLWSAILHAYERFALSSISSLLSYAVYAGAMYAVLSQGMGLRSLAWAFVAQQAVATLTLVPPVFRHLSAQGIGFVGWARMAQVGKVSWRVQISGLLTIAAMQGPLLIVARMQPLQVANFGPGSTFAQQLKLIPMNAVIPIQSMLGRSVGRQGAEATEHEFAHLQRLWVQSVTGWCFVGAPAAFVGVNVWLPLEGNLAGQIAAVMLLAQWLSLLPQVVLQWQLLQGRAEFEMWSSALTAAVLLVGSLLLVPVIGAMGAAVAAVLGYLFGLVLLLVLTKRSLPVPGPSALADVPWWQAVLSGALSTALVLSMSQAIENSPLPDGGLGLLLCGAAAAPALAVFVLTTWGPLRIWRLVLARLPRRRSRERAGGRA